MSIPIILITCAICLILWILHSIRGNEIELDFDEPETYYCINCSGRHTFYDECPKPWPKAQAEPSMSDEFEKRGYKWSSEESAFVSVETVPDPLQELLDSQSKTIQSILEADGITEKHKIALIIQQKDKVYKSMKTRMSK